MARKRRKTLARHMEAARPDLEDPAAAIAEGRVRVAGRIVTNPDSLVDPDAPLVVTEPMSLRGAAKLRTALAPIKDWVL